MDNGTDRKLTTPSASAKPEQSLIKCPAWCDVDHAGLEAEAIRIGDDSPTVGYHSAVLVDEGDVRVELEVPEAGAQPRFWIDHPKAASLDQARAIAEALSRGSALLD